jgi:hypothetical protein
VTRFGEVKGAPIAAQALRAATQNQRRPAALLTHRRTARWRAACFALFAMTHARPLDLSPLGLDRYRRQFAADGFVLFEGVVGRAELDQLTEDVLTQLRAEVAAGRLFHGGGLMSGHLNCFPGAGSRFVYDALQTKGIFDIARALSAVPLRMPNIGCNLNLAGSHAQNEHIDGYAAAPFLVLNVAAVDTDLRNGAMEVLPGTHQRVHKYWEIALGRLRRRRVVLKQGDALLRISTLWHRGMPNLSGVSRPMLAFSWESGGNDAPDPYAIHGGKITFLPNRFRTDWRGRLVERAFVMAPKLGRTFHVARSFFAS